MSEAGAGRPRDRLLRVALVTVLVAGVIGAGSWAWRTRAPQEAGTVDIETLGVYGQVLDFSLTERSRRTVRLADLHGKVWLANFMYTKCTDTCPTQSLRVSRLQTEFAAEPGLRLVSITVDPEHDTPDVLARYAERYGADPERWLFLTGPKRAIYRLAKEGFKLGVVDPDDPQASSGLLRLPGPRPAYATHGSKGLVIHGSRLVLVDGRGRIRAYHSIDDPASTPRLRENLRVLLAER